MPSAMPVPAAHYTTHRRSKTKLDRATSVNSGKAVLAIGEVGIMAGSLSLTETSSGGDHRDRRFMLDDRVSDRRAVVLAEAASADVRPRTISDEFGDELRECSDSQRRGGLRKLDGRERVAGLQDVSPGAAPQPDGEEPGFGGGRDVGVPPVAAVGDLITGVA